MAKLTKKAKALATAIDREKLHGVDEALARQAFALASAKLPIKTAFVQRMLG